MAFVKSQSAFAEVPVNGVLNTSFSVDPGNNRLIVALAIGEKDSPARGLPAVTLGGQAFTQILYYPEGTDGSEFHEDHWAGIIKEADIPAGTAVAADWGSGNNDVALALFQFDDVPQNTPTGATGTRSSLSTFEGASITTGNAGSLILAVNTSVRSSSTLDLTPGWALSQDIRTSSIGNNGIRAYAGFRGPDPVGTYDDCPGTLTSNLAAMNAVAVEIRQGAGAGSEELGANETAHGNTPDVPVFAQSHKANIGSSGHLHMGDAISLSQVHQIAAHPCGHANSADAAVLSQFAVLTTEDAGHGLVADGAQFLIAGVFGPHNSPLLHASTVAGFVQNQFYIVHGYVLGHAAGTLFLSQAGTLPLTVRRISVPAPHHALTIKPSNRTHSIKGG